MGLKFRLIARGKNMNTLLAYTVLTATKKLNLLGQVQTSEIDRWNDYPKLKNITGQEKKLICAFADTTPQTAAKYLTPEHITAFNKTTSMGEFASYFINADIRTSDPIAHAFNLLGA